MYDENVPQSTEGIVAKSRAFVVYDPSTGDVLHIHHCVTFLHAGEGDEAPEVRARRMAGPSGIKAAVLEVDPSEVGPRKSIRVEPANRRVVRF